MTNGLSAFLEQYHEAARRFARADPEGIKAIYSRADDVVLANPFGPAVVGWDAVGSGLEFASSRLQDGDVSRFEVLARYESGDMVVVHTLEDWRARVPGRPAVEPFQLRATSVLRPEKRRLANRSQTRRPDCDRGCLRSDARQVNEL